MSDIQIQGSKDKVAERKTIATPNFIELMYEVEKLINEGWSIDQQAYPFFNFYLYEVHFVKPLPVEVKQRQPRKSTNEG